MPTRLAPYRDERGNEIVCAAPLDVPVKIKFTGSGNRVHIKGSCKLQELVVDFDCDNGLLEIGPSKRRFTAAIRIGQDSTVRIGSNVSSTTKVTMSAAEGTEIRIGNDVMFASENQVRADDGHPIFDVRTGKRVNVSRSIRIGNHVWLGRHAVVLGGGRIGDGTVIGYGSIVTGTIPNNCVAVGSPARVVRRHIAWERDHLSLRKPFYKPDASTVRKTRYWNLTVEPPGRGGRPGWQRWAARTRLGRRLARSPRVRRLLRRAR